MELLLLRHGEAVEDAPGLGDEGRWLTGKGRQRTRSVAHFLVQQPDRRPVEIWTSPLVRAVQTAEVVAEAAELTDEVSVLSSLSTAGAPREVLRHLERYKGTGPLLLVGHEPGLSVLAQELLGAATQWPGFKKSGVLAVHWKGHGPATLRFVLDPKHLTLTTAL